jgi:hypothetical protein
MDPGNRYPYDVNYKGTWYKAQDLSISMPELYKMMHDGSLESLSLDNQDDRMSLFGRVLDRVLELRTKPCNRTKRKSQKS